MTTRPEVVARPGDAHPEAAVAFRGLSKTFPGMRALDDVSFAVGRGEFHALVGGNGSGKSTLIKILAGVYQSDPGGEISAGGDATDAHTISPRWSHAHGIRFVHQDLALFAHMSVAENLFAGSRYPRTPLGSIDWRTAHRKAQEALDRLGIAVSSRAQLDKLRPAEQTLVAITRCLFVEGQEPAGLLVLDEPTSRLPQAEVDELLERLEYFVSQGQSILYVSHRLDEILAHAHMITVLRDGHHIETRQAAGLDRRVLTSLIVGAQRELMTPRVTRPIQPEVVLAVKGLTGGRLNGLDLELHKGEILGVAGLVGSGRTSLLEFIFGARRAALGTVMLGQQRLKPGRIGSSIASGLAYVPEDRPRDGAFRNLGLDMNLSMSSLRRYATAGVLRLRAELAAAREDVRRFGIRTPGTRAPLVQLSGGNQQKAILARWLRRRPRVLLLDEPTQGVDVGARAEIYHQIEGAAEEGTSVLLVSSDLEELLHLSDRVVVLAGGRIVDSAQRQQITRDWVATRMFDADMEESK